MEKPVARVLLVDDEPALLKVVSVYLGRLGYAITSANTTDEAWAQMETAPGSVDIAVLDASMRGMATAELARRLLGADAELRVLIASGYQVDVSELAALAPGRAEFLPKPFTPEMLAKAIRRMIGAQEAGV